MASAFPADRCAITRDRLSRPEGRASNSLARAFRGTGNLDALGNWDVFNWDPDDADDGSSWDLDQSRTHNIVNEIGTIGANGGTPDWVDPVHDAAGNMTLAPQPDLEATAGEALVCEYDAWNRLTAVYADSDEDADGQADAGDTLIAEYEYDGLHRRITRIDKTAGVDVTYEYYYNTSWQVLYVEREVSGLTIPLKAYVWDLRYIDAPVVRFRNTDGDMAIDDETLYYTNDANMNVTALVDPSDGSVVERYTYDPYGQPTVLDDDWSDDGDGDSDVDNEILYCGYRYDPKTGLYHVRFRPYHPTLGRWPVRDFGGYVDGMSLYQYASAAPVRLVDAMGLWGSDFHHDLTLKLAKMAKIACAEDVARWANRPDEDERDAPSSFKAAAQLRTAAALLAATGGSRKQTTALRKQADRRWNQARKWHFPVSDDGEVHPASYAAMDNLGPSYGKCEIVGFSEGLHTYQDSCSHQGRPVYKGLGHARGAKWVPPRPLIPWWVRPAIPPPVGPALPRVWKKGHWKRLSGKDAALSHSADDMSIWPEDVRVAAFMTYWWLLKFKKRCPCACPGPEGGPVGKKVITSSGKAESKRKVWRWLLKKFPGRNKV